MELEDAQAEISELKSSGKESEESEDLVVKVER